MKFRKIWWQNTRNKVKIQIANGKSYDRWKTNFINLTRVSTPSVEGKEKKKIKYKIEQRIQEGNPQANKNKCLTKGKHANLINFEQMQHKTII